MLEVEGVAQSVLQNTIAHELGKPCLFEHLLPKTWSILSTTSQYNLEKEASMDEVGKAEETATALTERSIILCVVISAQLSLQRVPISSAAWCSCHSHHS
jgi:hypothetical protein